MVPARALSALGLTALLLADPCAPAPEITFTAEDLPGSCADLAAAGGPTRDGEGLGSDGAAWGSLQEALTAAPEGTTLTLAPGSYCVNLAIPPRAITLTGAGAELTTLDGGGCGGDPHLAPCSVLRVVEPPGRGESGSPVVEGVSVTGGLGTAGGLYGAGHDRVQGGGILVTAGALTLRDARVYANQAADDGGGIFASGADLTLERVALEANEAGADGGGLLLDLEEGPEPQGAITATTLTANAAGGRGGGLFLKGQHLSLEGVEIQANTAAQGGGMSWIATRYDDPYTPADVSFTAVTLAGNVAEEGGGLYSAGVLGDLTGLSITGNDATLRGGGARISSSVLYWLTASGNRAPQGGGAYANNCTLNDARLTGNQAEDDGGGIYTSASVSLYRAFLAGNEAGDLGGGLCAGPEYLYVDNLAAVGNTARAGGGAYLYQVYGDVISGALVSNVATGGAGGGLYVNGGFQDLVGLVIAHNQGSASAGDVYAKDGNHWMSYSVVAGGIGAIIPWHGMVQADPQLLAVPPAGSWEGADLHLAATSPAIDLTTEWELDADGSPMDAGMYGRAYGAQWDVDRDGLPAYFWPGAWEAAPEGYEASEWDGEDLPAEAAP